MINERDGLHLKIEIKDSYKEAPNYNTGENGGEGFKGAKLTKAIVVRKGMESGLDTVDLHFEDENGQKFIALVSGNIIKMLAATVNIGSADD